MLFINLAIGLNKSSKITTNLLSFISGRFPASQKCRAFLRIYFVDDNITRSNQMLHRAFDSDSQLFNFFLFRRRDFYFF